MEPDTPAPAPDETIDTEDGEAVKRWADHFGITAAQIEEAVLAVGPRVADVQRHLLDQGASAGAG
ncbi:DUF3606 domain-containing protein [Rubrivivax gelatinosus]|nr:DUF3606 domain-containing protein [Rubrivivax gelatinosus]